MFNNKNKIIVIMVIIAILIVCYYLFFNNREENRIEEFYIKEENKEVKTNEEKLNKNIIVHIMGEVINEGIVEIKEGSRVSDAIDAAGGLKENADVSNVNLAFVLEDGMKIIIPSKQEDNLSANNVNIITDGGENVISKSNSKGGKTLININTASQDELESLPGIGSAIALRIVSYREENGKFNSVDDIKNVNGIGDNKFNNIKDLICVQK